MRAKDAFWRPYWAHKATLLSGACGRDYALTVAFSGKDAKHVVGGAKQSDKTRN